jgi:hypothetical protein
MDEAIFILEKEKKLLEDCLKGWKSQNHPEAFKQRNIKLAQICRALTCLRLVENNVNPFTNEAFVKKMMVLKNNQ